MVPVTHCTFVSRRTSDSRLQYRIANEARATLIDTALSDDGWISTSGDEWNLWWGRQRPRGGSPRGPRLVSHLAGARCLEDEAERYRLLWSAHNAASAASSMYVPRTFEMPGGRSELLRVAAETPDAIRIAKANAPASRSGLRILAAASDAPHESGVMIQEYVSTPDPIDGITHTVRVYVLVSSLDPLVVHLFRDVFVTPVVQPIARTHTAFSDPSVVRTHRDDILRNTPERRVPISTSSKMAQADIAARWTQIQHIATMTILAARDTLLIQQRQIAGFSSFAIVGMDVLFDASGKGWLIGCHLPLFLDTEADAVIESDERQSTVRMVRDAVRLVLAAAQSDGSATAHARTVLESAGQFELLVPSDMAATADEMWLPRRKDRALFEAAGVRPPSTRTVQWPVAATILTMALLRSWNISSRSSR
ncbi:MAG: hypothetical protein QM736_18845 [Vicinamibacterales bacterium]